MLRISLSCLFCLISLPSFSASSEGENPIEAATQSTALIKTHLLHGFLEDNDDSGRWSGAGFLIDREKGWIVTNAHVAGYGPSELRLRFESQDDFIDAERVFIDSKYDIAVISTQPELIPEHLTPLDLECEYDFARGTEVFSVGHPEDQEFTTSLGVIAGQKSFPTEGTYYTTDLVTESGSSGGPVISIGSGTVIGMMTAKYSSSDLGFMTRAKDICKVVDLMKAGQNPARPRLEFQTMFINAKPSATVGIVFDRSIGLKEGDKITYVNSQKWDPVSDGDLADMLRGQDSQAADLTVERDGESRSIRLPLKFDKSIHEKDWVYFTGLLITEDTKIDARKIRGGDSGPLLLIESINTDFDSTEDIEFFRSTEIIATDGQYNYDLQEFYSHVSSLAENEKITILGREYNWTAESYSQMYQHSFPVVDLDCGWCADDN